MKTYYAVIHEVLLITENIDHVTHSAKVVKNGLSHADAEKLVNQLDHKKSQDHPEWNYIVGYSPDQAWTTCH